MKVCVCGFDNKEKYKMDMLKGHDLWSVIDGGGRTRVWCWWCAGDAEHKSVKLLKHRCRGQPEGERDRTNICFTEQKSWKKVTNLQCTQQNSDE